MRDTECPKTRHKIAAVNKGISNVPKSDFGSFSIGVVGYMGRAGCLPYNLLARHADIHLMAACVHRGYSRS